MRDDRLLVLRDAMTRQRDIYRRVELVLPTRDPVAVYGADDQVLALLTLTTSNDGPGFVGSSWRLRDGLVVMPHFGSHRDTPERRAAIRTAADAAARSGAPLNTFGPDAGGSHA